MWWWCSKTRHCKSLKICRNANAFFFSFSENDRNASRITIQFRLMILRKADKKKQPPLKYDKIECGAFSPSIIGSGSNTKWANRIGLYTQFGVAVGENAAHIRNQWNAMNLCTSSYRISTIHCIFSNAMDTFFVCGLAENGTLLVFCFIFRRHSLWDGKVLHFFRALHFDVFRSICSIFSGYDELLDLVYRANFVSMFEFEMDL